MLNAKKSDETYARYNGVAIQFIGQFVNESRRTDLADLAYEDLSVAAAHSFLQSDGRWSREYIRQLAGVLTQWIEGIGNVELIPASQTQALLQALKEARPEPCPKTPNPKSPKRKRRRPAKSITVVNLRRLIRYFRDLGDGFSLWIAGYLQVASRIGWRPGEVVDVWLDGIHLCARAEKDTNERGLYGMCEVGLHEYPAHLIEKLEVWILETERLANEYDGRWNLREAAKKQISRACEDLRIRPISLSTLRHHAIACMKKSGLTREEIAVIVNHASTRTATERYGKARTGSKRAKKRFRIDPWRLTLVRKKARAHGQKRTPTPH
jgi:integrase